MRLIPCFLLLALPALPACIGDATGRAGGHSEVAGIRLFAADSLELTPEIRFAAGWPSEVEVRFVDAAGNEIPDLQHRHRAELHWEPAGAVIPDIVEMQPFRRGLRVIRPCEPNHALTVGYGHRPHADERFFGPLPVRVENPVASVKLFTGLGEEVTSTVPLVQGQAVNLEVRFYGCDGAPVTTLGEADGIRFYWSSIDFAEDDEVEGERFVRRATALVTPGTAGTISVGFGRGPEHVAQVFGPFPVRVTQ